MKRFIIILLLLSSSALAGAQELTILHMNDTHSHVEPEKSGSDKGFGGVVEQTAYIDSVRCADKWRNVLLLHAGDFSQGTSYFTELEGNLEIDVLNAMEFDAVCLGNHEFDNGLDELARRLGGLKMPVLCANYDFTLTPLNGLVRPYTVLRRSGKKIGVIGLLTDLSSVVEKEIAEKLKYEDPAATADRFAAMLKEMGCDLVICLTHLGYEGEYYTDQQLASQTRYVDVIVGGHSHTFLEDLVKVKNLDGKDVIIVTDGKWGRNIGKLSVEFSR